MRFHLKLLVAGLALLILHLQSHAQVAFTKATNYVVGAKALSVLATDVNYDGKVDLVGVVNSYTPLLVFTNNGNGNFGSNAAYATGYGTTSVAAADVNGDGKVDLICANQGLQFVVLSNSVTVFTNNGNGGFTLSVTLNAGTRPHSVAAADVNGDGKVDVVCANASSSFPGGNTLTIFTNNGNGNFALSTSFGINSLLSVIAADVNGDGWMDLITGGGALSVFTNNQTGGFVLAFSQAVARNPLSVAAADLNRDGRLDLCCVNSTTTTLTIFTNNGGGSFVLSSTPTVGFEPAAVTAADVNGDGWPDLISANFVANTLSVLTNDGSGGFALANTCAVGLSPDSVAVADLNRDGRGDLICANQNSFSVPGTLSVLMNVPTLTIKPSGNNVFVSWPSSWTNWTLLQNSDLRTTNWIPSTGIADDATNKILTLAPTMGNLFFRLFHP